MSDFDTKTASGGKANPIDQTVRDLIEGVRSEQGGFVLSIANQMAADGKKISIEVGHQVQEIVLPRKDRSHTLGEIQSVIDYALKYGSKEKSILFVGDTGVTLVLDDSVDKGNRELIKLAYTQSRPWQTWKALLDGKYLSHRELLEHLIAWNYTLAEPEILLKMREAPVNAQIKQQSEIARDTKTIGYMVTTSAGEALVKFPEKFNITLPIFDMDEGDNRERWPTLNVTLLIDLPVDPSKGHVRFGMRSPDVYAAYRKRVKHEIDQLNAGLPEWLILAGDCGYEDPAVIINPDHVE